MSDSEAAAAAKRAALNDISNKAMSGGGLEKVRDVLRRVIACSARAEPAPRERSPA